MEQRVQWEEEKTGGENYVERHKYRKQESINKRTMRIWLQEKPEKKNWTRRKKAASLVAMWSL